MKTHLNKLLRYGFATGLAVVLGSAIVQTASATPVTGWGVESGYPGNVVTSEDGVGGFTMSNTVAGSGAPPRALFPTISLTNVGDAITLSGTYTFSSGQNYNEQFRFGLFNTAGLATGLFNSGR